MLYVVHKKSLKRRNEKHNSEKDRQYNDHKKIFVLLVEWMTNKKCNQAIL